MKVDNFKRQSRLAQEYADHHGLDVDEHIFEGLGISAFKAATKKQWPCYWSSRLLRVSSKDKANIIRLLIFFDFIVLNILLLSVQAPHELTYVRN